MMWYICMYAKSNPISSCFSVARAVVGVWPVALHQREKQPIGEENRGFRLLKKMGWKQGQGLGAKGDGITVPVVLGTQVATLGLGKAAEDDR